MRNAAESSRPPAHAIPPQASAETLNHLAVQFKRQGQLSSALACYQRALAQRPDYVEARFNLAIALRDSGQLAEAVLHFQRALDKRPDVPLIHLALGSTLVRQGELAAAIDAFREALRLDPSYADAWFNLGNVLLETGKLPEAIDSYRRATDLQPQRPDILTNLGNALREAGRAEEAVDCYRQALRSKPQMAETLTNLGVALKGLGRTEEAIECLQQALGFQPDLIAAHTNLGNIFKDQGRIDCAQDNYQRLIALRPQEPWYRLRTATLWPLIFHDRAEMEQHWRRLWMEIEHLTQANLSTAPETLVQMATEPPFNIEFWEGNLRQVKQAYASLFRHCFAGQPPLARRTGDRLVVGVVVTRGHEPIFLRSLRGVLTRLDRTLFEVIVFCCPSAEAVLGAALPGVRVEQLPQRFPLAAAVLQQAACDVLYYWEVGTDSLNYFLPFLRLAPVQCTSWGVQVTSGIPQLDYYLSSSLLESEHGQEHYSEMLLHFKTLPTYQFRPPPLAAHATRQQFGLPSDATIYLCAQNLGKIHLDFDPWLREILRRDPRGLLVLTADASGVAAARLRQRMAETTPEANHRIVFLPRLHHQQYRQLISIADVLLDPPHFGGTNSAYDGLALSKPIITCPTQYNRGRYTWACYQKMDLLDCVAGDGQHYVDLAVRLGTDPQWRAEISRQITDRVGVLFEEDEAVREHERALLQMLATHRNY